MLAVFTHMRQKYGFVPNGIDVVNEPDNFADWSNGTRIGRVIVATANKLQAAGFAVPEFIAPSTANTGNSIQKIDEIDVRVRRGGAGHRDEFPPIRQRRPGDA